jgi:hypothetical protein
LVSCRIRSPRLTDRTVEAHTTGIVKACMHGLLEQRPFSEGEQGSAVDSHAQNEST